MSSPLQTLDATMVAKEFFLVGELLEGRASTDPLRRWLEYQAYAELVRLAATEGPLPPGFDFESLDMKSILDWIRGTKELGFSFQEKMKELLLELKAGGSDVFDKICDFYCAYKSKLDAGFTGASMVLGSAELAAMLSQYKFDLLLFKGIPVTSFASLAIKFGVLDKVCDCKNRPA